MKVYLSGGMQSGWQQVVTQAVPRHTYLNPCEHGLSEPSQYTLWDLMAIDASDLVFAYLEEGNPSGFGLCIEIGYAKKAKKYIVFVNENTSKYLKIVEQCADIVILSLQEGINILCSLSILDK